MRLGTAYVVVNTDRTKLKPGLDSAYNTVDSSTKKMQASINRIAWTAVAVGAAAATAAIVVGTKKAIDASSDLNETVSKSNTIFGQNAQDMLVWAKTSATSMGLSKQAALENAATIGNMFNQLGAGTEIAAENSRGMVQLASDIASFHNVTGGANSVLTAMMSAFRGEYDALQRYIPTIKAATVQQEALSMTGKQSAKDLTELEKATAAMNIIINDAGVATGDFARTSQELANQQRILDANINDTLAAIGDGLTPIVTELYKEINQWFENNKEIISQNMPGYIAKVADAMLVSVDILKASYEVFKSFQWAFAGAMAKIYETRATTLGWRREITDSGKEGAIAYGKIGGEVKYVNSRIVEMINSSRETAKTWRDVQKDTSEDFDKSNKKLEELRDTIESLKDYTEDVGDTNSRVTNQIISDTGEVTREDKKSFDQRLKYAQQWGVEAYRGYSFTQAKMAEYNLWRNDEERKQNELTHKQFLESLKASDSFIDGLKLGYIELQEAATTWGMVGQKTFQDFTASAKSSFADFINPLKEDFLDVESLWQNMLDDMVSSLSKSVADMAVEWALGKAAGWLTGGGLGALSDILFAHEGIWKVGTGLKSDETTKIVKDKEMIVPPDYSEIIRRSLGEGATWDDLANAVKSGSAINGGATQTAFLKGTRDSFIRYMMSGIGTVNTSDLLRAAPQVLLMSMLTGGATSAARQGLGLTSRWADVGAAIGGIFGSLTANPALYAAAQVAGSAAVDLIGDALNLRSNEAIRDAFESQIGRGNFTEADVQAIADMMAEEEFVMGSFARGSGLGGVRRAGSYRLHEDETILSAADTRNVASRIRSGDRRSATINNYLVIDGVVTTKNVKAWFAELSKETQREKRGRTFLVKNINTAGLNIN